MTDWNLFDHYSFRARLQPALLTLVPAAIGIFAWTGQGAGWQSALWTLFGTAGGTYFFAMFARNLGKKLEPSLWQSWGGAPTTQMLRHSGPANPVMRERWHKKMSEILGRPFPTATEESEDPRRADEIYEAAVKVQISKTRDRQKFGLVYKENVSYGFCRNLYAMKIIGVWIAGLGAVASAASGVSLLRNGSFDIAPWVYAGVDVVFLICWVFVIESSWVKVPAFAYAERLLESTEQ